MFLLNSYCVCEAERQEVELCYSTLFAGVDCSRVKFWTDLPQFLKPSSGTWFLGSPCFSNSAARRARGEFFVVVWNPNIFVN